jgi:hypothetical protein
MVDDGVNTPFGGWRRDHRPGDHGRMTTLHHSSLSVPGSTRVRTARPGPTLGRRPSWPRSAALGAAIWSTVYGWFGVWWISHPARFPFGVGPASGPASSLLVGVRPETGAPVVAVLGFTGAAVALLMSRMRPHGPLGPPMLAFAAAITAGLLVLVPDARVLAVAAYAPIFLAGAPFGWPPVSYWDAIPWPIWYQFGCIAGGLLWGATTLAYFRLARGACVACGRRGTPSRWTSPAAAARWGRWGVVFAVVAPLAYATTRLAWVVGIPLGISESLLRQVRTEMIGAAAGLASVAIGGAILTIGLVRPWGETFPRWMPILRGQRVPPALAIAPATFVAVLVFAAGLGITRDVLRDGLRHVDWLAHAPGLLWPFWGLGLGAATLAYYYRRRGRCPRCGRS